jgi:ribosomal protein S18 acetylase RimI-like enzyme
MSNTITDRSYSRALDYHRVRRLLIETYPFTMPDFNWEIRRWDGWHTHRLENDFDTGWEERLHLWETGQGRLVGLAHSEGGRGDLHLEVDPAFRLEIEEAMLVWGEDHLAADDPNGEQKTIGLDVFEFDAPRQRLLARRGYLKTTSGWVVRRLYFAGQPIPAAQIAPGYGMRQTAPGDPAESQRLADVLNAGFDRPNFHQAAEVQHFWDFSPSFRHDLNLVAVAPDGSFAAHVGVTYDEDNRRGVFEPVCTAPAHRRKGLAQALMFEGLRRLEALGAREVTVATGDAEAANALYDSIGFTEVFQGYAWTKVFGKA